MDNTNLKTNMTGLVWGAIFLAGVIVGGIIGFRWLDLQNTKAKLEAIQACAEVAQKASPEGFNGAVYKICVKDKGYETKIK